jgi:hypothetical protein
MDSLYSSESEQRIRDEMSASYNRHRKSLWIHKQDGFSLTENNEILEELEGRGLILCGLNLQ